MSTSDLGRELSRAVVLFHQAVAHRVGLSAGDLKTLELIEQEGPFSATELAARTGLTGAAITALVGRLQSGDHVSREPDPADRRRVVIRALPSAHLELGRAFAGLGSELGRLFGEYSAAEQAAIVDYLAKMVVVLREQTAVVAQGER